MQKVSFTEKILKVFIFHRKIKKVLFKVKQKAVGDHRKCGKESCFSWRVTDVFHWGGF